MEIVDDLMTVIIAGGRTFNDLSLLADRMGTYTQRYMHIQVVSGTCRGADQLGEIWARDFTDMPVLQFPADWDTHGKRAGWIRNNQMADIATHVVVFWNGQVAHSGSFMMIEIARKRGLPLKIVRY